VIFEYFPQDPTTPILPPLPFLTTTFSDVLEDDQIVVPCMFIKLIDNSKNKLFSGKKLYRPRGPPRFGKRGLLVMNRQRNFPE